MSAIVLSIDKFYAGNRCYQFRRPYSCVAVLLNPEEDCCDHYVIDCLADFGFVADGSTIQSVIADFEDWIDNLWCAYVECPIEQLHVSALPLRNKLMNMLEVRDLD